jgi:hypothetical protein
MAKKNSFTVIIDANASDFDKALAGMQNAFASFGKRMFEIAGGMQLSNAIDKMASSLSDAMKQGIEQADKLGKHAKSFRMPVDEFSAYAAAARVGGLEVDALAGSVDELSKKMVEAAQNTKGPAAIAFRDLGISVRSADGSMKSQAQLLSEIADKFSRYQDGAAKSAIATQLFGTNAKAMTEFLNQGSAGIGRLMQEAEALGIVIDGKTSEAATRFRENLNRLSLAKDGIVLKLTAQMLPALEQFTNWMIEGGKSSGLFEVAAQRLGAVLDGLTRTVLLVYDNSQLLIDAFSILVAAKVASVMLGAGVAMVKFAAGIRAATLATLALNAAKTMTTAKLVAFGGLVAWATGNLDTMKEKLGELAGAVVKFLPEDMTGKIKDLLKGAGVDLSALTRDLSIFNQETSNTKKNLDDLKVSNEQAAKAIEKAFENVRKQIVAMQAQAQTYGMTTGQAAEYIKKKELEALVIEKLGFVTKEHSLQIQQLSRAYADATLEAEAFRLKMELRTPMQVMQDEVRKLDELLQRGKITWEEYGDAMMRARARGAQSLIAMGSEAARLMGQIFEDSKGAAIAQAVLSGAEGVARSLGAYPWPFAGIMAGLHAAAAAAQVNRIRNTNRNSRSLSATSAGRGAATAAAPVVNEQIINLRGFNPESSYRGRDVEEVFDMINSGLSRGMKFRIAYK